MVKSKVLKSSWSSDGIVLVRDLEEKHIIQSVDDLAVFGTVPLLPGETPATEAPGVACDFFAEATTDPHDLSMQH